MPRARVSKIIRQLERRHAAARDDRHGARPASRSLLIADEPTTALDVTIQAQILALLKRLRAEYGMANAVHHARHGRGGGDRRPRGGHVRRAGHGVGPGAGRL